MRDTTADAATQYGYRHRAIIGINDAAQPWSDEATKHVALSVDGVTIAVTGGTGISRNWRKSPRTAELKYLK